MSEKLTYGNLIVPDFPLLTKQVTILSGQNLAAGSLIGKISKVCPTTGTADAGNTGNGTCTAVAAGKVTELGTYTLRCILAGTGSATFAVYTPNGERLYDAEGGTAYSCPHINFLINIGGADYMVGDIFTIAITSPSSDKFKLALLAAVDGSQELENAIVLGEATDASLADTVSFAYMTGTFNKNKMVFGTGYTATNTAEALSKHSIFLKDSAQY